MIEIVPRDGEPHALLCPAIVCDACRRQVTGPGNLIWFIRYQPHTQTSPVFAAHKPCSRRVEAMLGALYPHEQGWQRLWDEADTFLAQLTHNHVEAFADDPDGRYHRTVVAHPGGLILAGVDGQPAAICQVCGDRPKRDHYCADCGRQG